MIRNKAVFNARVPILRLKPNGDEKLGFETEISITFNSNCRLRSYFLIGNLYLHVHTKLIILSMHVGPRESDFLRKYRPKAQTNIRSD